MRRGVALAAVLLAGPAALRAQSTPVARSAVQLAAEGRSDSARVLLDAELARRPAGDSSWVEALYWRGRLAAAGSAAERDLRRVAVEYSNSPWADDALLQLSQLALAGGNAAAALDYATRLRTDYPGSDLRARAALWAGRASFDVGETRAACALLDSAQAEAGNDVEFVNQVLFYRGRCTESALAPAAPAPDIHVTRDSVARPAPAPAPRPPAQSYGVQVVAARSQAAARDAIRRLGPLGRGARIVPASGIYRVRLGPYASAAIADSIAGLARRRVGGRPFVVKLP